MITALIDYGMGNLRSVSKALEKVGLKPLITSDAHIVSKADAVVLPGVGAFKDAVQNLKKAGLFPAVIRHIEKGKPYLGICLGLQLLFERSYEFGTEEGFGLLEGDVVLLPTTVKVPHIGWNQVWKKKDNLLFENIKDGDYFYFVHSYRVVPKKSEVIAALTDYGINFVSAVEYGNVFGVQFHPEKSQKLGLKVLENFKKVVYG